MAASPRDLRAELFHYHAMTLHTRLARLERNRPAQPGDGLTLDLAFDLVALVETYRRTRKTIELEGRTVALENKSGVW